MNERTVGTVALLHGYSPIRDMLTRLCRFTKQNRSHRDPQIVSLSTARIKYVHNYWKQKHRQVLSIDLLSCPLTLVQPCFPDARAVRLAKTLSRKGHANNPSSYEGAWHASSILYFSLNPFIYLFIYLLIYLWSLYIFIYLLYDKRANNYSSTHPFFLSRKSQSIFQGIPCIVKALSAKYRPDSYRRDKSVKFGTELP